VVCNIAASCILLLEERHTVNSSPQKSDALRKWPFFPSVQLNCRQCKRIPLKISNTQIGAGMIGSMQPPCYCSNLHIILLAFFSSSRDTSLFVSPSNPRNLQLFILLEKNTDQLLRNFQNTLCIYKFYKFCIFMSTIHSVSFMSTMVGTVHDSVEAVWPNSSPAEVRKSKQQQQAKVSCKSEIIVCY
jgi:hypothetical protein